jgi:hypothetical protein
LEKNAITFLFTNPNEIIDDKYLRDNCHLTAFDSMTNFIVSLSFLNKSLAFKMMEDKMLVHESPCCVFWQLSAVTGLRILAARDSYFLKG